MRDLTVCLGRYLLSLAVRYAVHAHMLETSDSELARLAQFLRYTSNVRRKLQILIAVAVFVLECTQQGLAQVYAF